MNKREIQHMRRFILIFLIALLAAGLVNAQATKPQTVKLSIAGMTCQDCATKVDKALRGVKGVKDVKVDLEKKTAIVTMASATVKPEALFKAVDVAGFKASVGKLPAGPSMKEEGCDGCMDKEGKKEAGDKKEDCCKPEATKKAPPKS
jgi:copper chaperone CopZ